jgi:tRNA A-37 threonylcarbamoyl transferase component Bud32
LCGVRTAQVIATADHRILGVPVRSFVVMEEIRDAIDAREANDSSLMDLARLLARLHQEGFTHRDLKETNILFNPAGVPHVIDLDGLKAQDSVTDEEAASNMGRLMQGLAKAGKLTGESRVTFLKTYCHARNMPWDALLIRPLYSIRDLSSS